MRDTKWSEIQCVADEMTKGGYSAIKLLPERGMAVISWGNMAYDNHVVTYEPISCGG